MASDSLKFILSTIIGGFFGIALEKGRVFEPLLIREQMSWTNFAMLKMFLCACIGSLISMTILSLIQKDKFKLRKTRGNILQVVVGCSILGAGMTISGACPGTVLAQMGSGVFNSFFTFFGGIVAALIITMYKEQIIKPLQNDFGFKRGFLDEIIGVQFHFIALPFACLFFLVVFVLEYLVPWYIDYPVDQFDYFPSMFAVAWPPYFSGLLIGLLQLPAYILVKKSLGCSTQYENIAGFIHVSAGTCKSSYVKKVSAFSFDNLWGIFFLVGAMLGACISSILSGSFHSAASVPLLDSFIGGFMIIFGSRIAGGCTSGHGITGFSSLNIDSFFSVPAMFASGTFVALFMF